MRSILLSVALFSLAACQEISTSPVVAGPELRLDQHGGDGTEFPPPPASDTGAFVQSADAGFFALNVTYLLNKPGTSGFLSFQRQQPEGVTIDPNARVQLHQGDFSGRGEISVQTATGLLVLDLANVTDASKFESCAAAGSPTDGQSSSEVAPDGGSCFTVVVAGGTFTPNGGEPGQADGAFIRPCPAIRGCPVKPGADDGPR